MEEKKIYVVVNLPWKKIDGEIEGVIEYIHLRRDINGRNSEIYHCGDDSGEVPPVLIPNTEVKLTSAENTLLETAREDRLLLHPLKKDS